MAFPIKVFYLTTLFCEQMMVSRELILKGALGAPFKKRGAVLTKQEGKAGLYNKLGAEC
jgi:hypothetical protein